jgi:tetratricopeptide (TPR) repeat protein
MIEARSVIENGKGSAQSYNDLALALTRRARETSDPAYYRMASEALVESLRRSPDNFDGKKVRTAILLGQHEFAEALREAKALNQRAPDDLMVYALLVEAHSGLGNYSEAEVAAQWLVDMRPGNLRGLTHAAGLREIFGDLDGAVELIAQAYGRTLSVETEERAWLLTRLGHLHRLGGRLKPAESMLVEAMSLFPGYCWAMDELARVRLGQKRYSDAVDLLRKRFAAAPRAETLYLLGDALKRDGRGREADMAFKEFETKARDEMNRADNANRELIYYYIDEVGRPQEALRVAEEEMSRHADAYTRGAYAWALWANQREAEAHQQMETAMAVGLVDPLLIEHARHLGIQRSASE